jgi:hypothetical protein
MKQSSILFSPVGTSDPVRDHFDGPFLHILRHYRPRKAYIVLTQYMEEWERRDQCFTKYARAISPETQLETISTGIVDASDFELFFPAYDALLDRISAEHPEDRILLNLSSATPQSIATLCAYLCSRATNRYVGIQVKTPERGANMDKKHYSNKEPMEDVLTDLLDGNPELYASIYGEERAPNRCYELTLRNYTKSYLLSRLQASIEKEDYAHLAALAEDGAGYLAAPFVDAAKAALMRYRYRIKEAKEHFRRAGLPDAMPVERYSKVLEFYLSLRHSFQRGDFNVFYSRLSPLAIEMAREALEKSFRFPIQKYIRAKNPRRSDEEVLYFSQIQKERPKLAKLVEDECGFSQPIKDDSLKLILLGAIMMACAKESGDADLKSLAAEFLWIRDQERMLRNHVDHHMVALNEQVVCGHAQVERVRDVIDRFDKLFIRVYRADASLKFQAAHLNSYQKMNRALAALLERA